MFLGISNFLEEISSLSHSVLSSISLHWLLRKAFLSLLVILWNSVFRCFYLSLSALPYTSLLFIAICKASSESHFAFLHFFFLRMVLIPLSCTMPRTPIHSSLGTLACSRKWSRSIMSDSLWPRGHQAPPSMGFSRQECWSGLPFPSPGNLPDLGIKPGSPALQAGSLLSEPQGSLN